MKEWLYENFETMCIVMTFVLVILLIGNVIIYIHKEESCVKTFPIEEVVFGREYVCPYCHIRKDFWDTQSPRVKKLSENQVEVIFRCRHCCEKIHCLNNL